MRPGKSEVLIDFVGDEPQIVLPAELGDAGNFVGSEYGAGRIVRAVDPNDARARRDGAGDAVEVGVKTIIDTQWHIDHERPACPDNPGIRTVNRLEPDRVVARSSEAVQCTKEPTLGSGSQHDIVGTAGPAGALLHPCGDGSAYLGVADDRRITGAVPPQGLDRCVDDRPGCRLV